MQSVQDDTIRKHPIQFSNTHATAFISNHVDKAEDILFEFGIKDYQGVILIIGAADNIDSTVLLKLKQLFGRGIAKAAAEAKAVIIDGGTNAGVMSLIGEAVAGRGYKSPLIGVAPFSKVSFPGKESGEVSLEPNHSFFVLVEGNEWGSETSMMFKILTALTNKTHSVSPHNGKTIQLKSLTISPIRCIAILAGGGTISRNELLYSVRQNIDVIIIEGSGGVADEITSAWKNKGSLPDDPVIAEIIADGNLHFHHLTDSVTGIERLIIREFGTNAVLMQSWETFADYDLNANLNQNFFDRIQLGIILLGILGTALAIFQQTFVPKNLMSGMPRLLNTQIKDLPWVLIHHFLLILPISLTILVTVANRFKQGSKWLLLRAGAESIKREIYKYRARAKEYETNADQQLALKVEEITRRTMRTEVNTSSLRPYDKDRGFPPYMYGTISKDDGFSYLTPDRYVQVRLDDQLNYFKKKSIILERQLKFLLWLTFIIGGVGTYLAAVNEQIWIALTTSVVAALGTYLGYRQTESTLIKYNQSATNLANVKSWWNALLPVDQARQENINSLVDHTEQVLQFELDGWVQQMQNALEELRNGESPKEDQQPSKSTKENDQKNH